MQVSFLSQLKYSVDLERSNSLLSQEIGKNIGMHDLWRAVAESPRVNTLNSILLKVLSASDIDLWICRFILISKICPELNSK